MKRITPLLIALVAAGAVCFSSCDALSGLLSGDERGFIALEFSITGENTLDVSSVRVDLSSDDSSSTFSESLELDESSLSAYKFVPEVPTGNWYVDVMVYDSSGALLVQDTLGSAFQVSAAVITTVTVTYEPSAGSDLTITWVSDTTVTPAVSINTDELDGCYILYADGDSGFATQDYSVLAGTGEFQAASSLSVSFPDGSSIDYGTKSLNLDAVLTCDGTSFSCTRYGGGYGTYEVKVTDLYGVSASAAWTFPHDDPYANIAYTSYPTQGSATFSVSGDTVYWNSVDSSVVQSIVLLIVEKASMGSATPSYVSAAALSGSEVSDASAYSSLWSPNEYLLIICTFDKSISDTSPFWSISNFYPEELIESLQSYSGYDFDFIGLSYTTFTTTT